MTIWWATRLNWTLLEDKDDDADLVGAWTCWCIWVSNLLKENGPVTQLLVLLLRLVIWLRMELWVARTRTGNLSLALCSAPNILNLLTLGRLTLRTSRLKLRARIRLRVLTLLVARAIAHLPVCSFPAMKVVTCVELLVSRTRAMTGLW